MQLQADRASLDLLAQRRGKRRIAFAKESQVDGKSVGGFQHAVHVPCARSARGSVGSRGGSRAAADQSRQAARKRGLHKLWTNEMNVRIDPAGGDDFSFTGDDFRSSTDDHSWRHSTHHIRIAGFADSRDSSVAY